MYIVRWEGRAHWADWALNASSWNDSQSSTANVTGSSAIGVAVETSKLEGRHYYLDVSPFRSAPSYPPSIPSIAGTAFEQLRKRVAGPSVLPPRQRSREVQYSYRPQCGVRSGPCHWALGRPFSRGRSELGVQASAV